MHTGVFQRSIYIYIYLQSRTMYKGLVDTIEYNFNYIFPYLFAFSLILCLYIHLFSFPWFSFDVKLFWNDIRMIHNELERKKPNVCMHNIVELTQKKVHFLIAYVECIPFFMCIQKKEHIFSLNHSVFLYIDTEKKIHAYKLYDKIVYVNSICLKT